MRSLALVLLAACQHAPPAAAPGRGAPRPARCTVVLVADAEAAVMRLSGGAFVLRSGGVLERYDREGTLTGAADTPLESLAPAGAYVCGRVRGTVGCFRDRHEELTCPGAPFAPEVELVGIPTGAALSGDLDAPLLRTAGGVWQISGTCEQHCVSLGCGEPRRCMDPCPAGAAPVLEARLVRRARPRILSKRRPATVTHPSK